MHYELCIDLDLDLELASELELVFHEGVVGAPLSDKRGVVARLDHLSGFEHHDAVGVI